MYAAEILSNIMKREEDLKIMERNIMRMIPDGIKLKLNDLEYRSRTNHEFL